MSTKKKRLKIFKFNYTDGGIFSTPYFTINYAIPPPYSDTAAIKSKWFVL